MSGTRLSLGAVRASGLQQLTGVMFPEEGQHLEGAQPAGDSRSGSGRCHRRVIKARFWSTVTGESQHCPDRSRGWDRGMMLSGRTTKSPWNLHNG
jgi:hypothetical protein